MISRTMPVGRSGVRDRIMAATRVLNPARLVRRLPDHRGTGEQLTVGHTREVPTAPPLQLAAAPPPAAPGDAVTFNLTGAQGGETTSFEVDAPGGGKFTGPPHTVADDGSVSATYQTTSRGASGGFTVVATGNQGTSVRMSFRVDSNGPITYHSI